MNDCWKTSTQTGHKHKYEPLKQALRVKKDGKAEEINGQIPNAQLILIKHVSLRIALLQ